MSVVLGIETSCDETGAAVVADGRRVLANEIASQIDIHRAFGGVVPEIASRQHTTVISELTQQALETADVRVDAIAATKRAGGSWARCWWDNASPRRWLTPGSFLSCPYTTSKGTSSPRCSPSPHRTFLSSRWWSAADTRSLSSARSPTATAILGTTRRRCRRRVLRQGGAPARPVLPRRPLDTARRRGRQPGGIPLPRAAWPTATTSISATAA